MLRKRLLSIACFLLVVTALQAQQGVSRFDVKLTDAQKAAVPEVSGGMPVLPGTMWAVVSIYEKGTTPKTQFRPANFLFCKNAK